MRYSLLVLGVWGLLWMLLLLASLRTNPHVVGEGGLRIRSGFQFDASIPWEEISAIRLRRSSAHRKLQIEHNQTGMSVALQGTSNVKVVFREPVPVRFLDGRQQASTPSTSTQTAQPHFLTAAQAHLASIPEAA